MPNNELSPSDAARLAQARELTLRHLAKSEMAKRIMEHQFKMYGSRQRLVANDISMIGGPKGDGNVAVYMGRQRDTLQDFYDWHPEGRSASDRVVQTPGDPGNYALVLQPNAPPSDFLAKLWHPHCPPSKTRVLFPELRCSCQDNPVDGYVENRDEDGKTAKMPVDRIDAGDAASLTNGIVSTSSVRCLLRLQDCFRIWDAPLAAAPILPSAGMGDGDVIVLGTPGKMPQLLPGLEATAPMKTSSSGVSVNSDIDTRPPSLYPDTSESAATPLGTELIKWVAFTRHHYRFQRTITVLAGKDELAVEAVLHMLTNETALLMLARELKCRGNFPNHFQALFAVHMVKGHPYARDIKVERVIDLDRAG